MIEEQEEEEVKQQSVNEEKQEILQDEESQQQEQLKQEGEGNEGDNKQTEEWAYSAFWKNETSYHKGPNVKNFPSGNPLFFQGQRRMNEYDLLETLGRGSFGKVKKVRRQHLGQDGVTVESSMYAAKVINKNSLESDRIMEYLEDGSTKMSNRLNLLYKEIEIYQHLDHPNIAKLYEIIDDETDEKLYMIMDLCDLGQLMQWNEDTQQYDPNEQINTFIINNYSIDVFSTTSNLITIREQIAQVIFYQVSLALDYLHSINIAHRDVKIDNILCKSDACELQHIQLADFSTVKQIKEQQRLMDCAGTSGFRCPEQQFSLDEGYDGKAADIWSLGISLLTFVNYKIPFWSESSNLETDINAKNNPLPFIEGNSNELINLVESMCQKEAEKRITIKEVMNHPFFSTLTKNQDDMGNE